jgi:hypothetical protein
MHITATAWKGSGVALRQQGPMALLRPIQSAVPDEAGGEYDLGDERQNSACSAGAQNIFGRAHRLGIQGMPQKATGHHRYDRGSHLWAEDFAIAWVPVRAMVNVDPAQNIAART